MKKQGLIYILIIILALGLLAQQTAVTKKISQLYRKGKLGEALNMINQEMKKGKVSQSLVQMKFNILMRQGEYSQALQLVENQLKTGEEKEELLAAKCSALIRLKKFPQALTVALKKDKLARTKSPWEAVNVANLYLRLENKVQALNWLDEAVRRGFIDYRMFEQPRYESLIMEKKLLALIEEIKLIIGLGEKAKDFTVPLLSGNSFTLSQHRGKVVLVYFWATWCKPCRQEMGYLRSYYAKLAKKGFEIVGINLDSNKNVVKKYLKKENIAWKTICSGQVWRDKLVKLYGVNSLPSTWIVDRKGHLRSFGLKGKALIDAINTILPEKK